MWFTKEHFEVAREAQIWGLAPRFEPGDVIARGFADLGYEEFQVLPGPKILSLTAASVTNLPADDTRHFFWIPSVDESLGLIERQGAEQLMCARIDGREWQVSCQVRSEPILVVARDIHLAALKCLLATYQRCFRKPEESRA
jgi:hypothetical protein